MQYSACLQPIITNHWEIVFICVFIYVDFLLFLIPYTLSSNLARCPIQGEWNFWKDLLPGPAVLLNRLSFSRVAVNSPRDIDSSWVENWKLFCFDSALIRFASQYTNCLVTQHWYDLLHNIFQNLIWLEWLWWMNEWMNGDTSKYITIVAVVMWHQSPLPLVWQLRLCLPRHVWFKRLQWRLLSLQSMAGWLEIPRIKWVAVVSFANQIQI